MTTNALNLELRDDIDPSGNNEHSVQLIHRDPNSDHVTTLGVFVISNGLNDHRMRTYRRAGDQGSADLVIQDEFGQMVDLKAAG